MGKSSTPGTSRSSSNSKSRPHSASASRRSKFGSPGPGAGGGVRFGGFGNDGRGQQSCRVYVGNLSYDTSWQSLKDHFRRCGNVIRADVMSRPDGQSKGCGIVEYSNASDAQRAIRELTDSLIDGRKIFVREDREDGGNIGGEVVSSGGGGSGCSVFVGNLSWEASWQSLKDHMRGAGNVVHVEVLTKPDGRSKGCAVVEYSHPREADRALRDMNGTELLGRELFVQPDERSGDASGRGAAPGRLYQHDSDEHIKIFVGNLDYKTSWQNLKDYMRRAGNVARADILKGPDGRSKGCGIVEYEHPKDAARALRELNEGTLDGRTVYVQEDKSPEERGSGGGGSGGNDGDACKLFVGNLAWETSWQELKDLFRQCGDVVRAEVIEGPDGRSKGFGTVRFANARAANDAISRLDGAELAGRRLHVRLDNKA